MPDHNQTIDAAIEDAREISQSMGERFTTPRENVLRFLLARQLPQKAYEIIENISISDKSAKPPTIYRALDFLCRIGLVHKIESEASYFVCSHKNHCEHETHVPLVLICQTCNQVIERHIHKIENLISTAANEENFKISKTLIEAHGVCADCNKKKQL